VEGHKYKSMEKLEAKSITGLTKTAIHDDYLIVFAPYLHAGGIPAIREALRS